MEKHNKLFKKINNIMKKFSSFLIVLLLMLASFTAGIEYPRGDVSQDGQVDISDVTVLIDYLLNGTWPDEPVTPPDDHEYVDLGLPSGTLWATCNVGANTPEEYGDYFAWGETEPKDYYDWNTYKWCNGSENTITKYCCYSDLGYNGFVDNKTELDPEDDAAYVNWGSSWCMPTQEQLQELIDECTWTWTQSNGVKGYLVTGPNENSMFLPAAGIYAGDTLENDDMCYYPSRILQYMGYHYVIHFTSEYVESLTNDRCFGYTVRAVRVFL